MEHIFKLSKHQTTVKTELLAGLTTFLSMVYIIFVNPAILSAAGMDRDAVFVATILSASFATLIMALLANFPVALASGMGINAFFAFTVVGALGYSWQKAMAAVFVSGIIFLIISLTGLRRTIINAIPMSLKHAVAAGIGFFITFIGLRNAEIIVTQASGLPGFGDLGSLGVLLAIIGFFLTAVLFIRKVPAAIFLGMVLTSILGLVFGVVSMPSQVFQAVPSMAPIFGGLFSALSWDLLLDSEFWIIVFSFFFIDFFDTSGMLIAVGQRIGLIDSKGDLEHGQQALVADAVGTIFGAVLGTTSVTSYVESMTGIEQGGRTGLTALVVAVGFLCMLFFSPLLGVVNAYVTAPALIMVGCLMVNSLGRIIWGDLPLTISSFLTVLLMVLTFSIASGIAAGLIAYPIMMLAAKRGKEVHPILYVLMLLFILHFVFI